MPSLHILVLGYAPMDIPIILPLLRQLGYSFRAVSFHEGMRQNLWQQPQFDAALVPLCLAYEVAWRIQHSSLSSLPLVFYAPYYDPEQGQMLLQQRAIPFYFARLASKEELLVQLELARAGYFILKSIEYAQQVSRSFPID